MSKFDQFLAYDPATDSIFVFEWDTAYDGVDNWFHWDDERQWYIRERGYLGRARKRYVILDQVPEHIHRARQGYL